ncbi:hypothetical protein Tco_0317161 [Tanacetum coccineum]
MSTLAKFMILFGADNRPPMLEKHLYDSWKRRMEIYMKNREHGRMILESVEHGPLIWPMIEENGMTRTKKYEELSVTEKIQADCDLKATNIILQGLPSDVYSLVNHHRVAKDLWERMINDMNIYKMKLEKFQVNSKFLNNLLPEWSKFVNDVKLIRDLHTTNFDHLYAYLEQHELHANEFRIMRERNQDQLALSHQYGSIHPTQHYSTTYPSTPHAITYPSTPHPNAYSSTIHQDACPQPQSIPQIEYTVSIINQQIHLAEFPQIDSGLTIPVFKQGDDPITAIKKMMSFLSTVVSYRFPTTNNQLRNSSNPRQQATIHDGRVTVQPVQGRPSSFDVGTSGTRANISGIGHMARQCPKPKRRRDATRFRDKVLLVEAQGSGKVLNEEELEFLADPGVVEGQVTHMVSTHNAAYQADDLDAYDSDCDDFSTAKAVLMANLSSYRSDVLSEVPHSKITHNDMLNQSVQEMQYSEQTHLVNYPENEITSDSNIIPYSQYLLEKQNIAVQDTNSSAQQDAMILYVFEQLSNQVTNCNKVNKDNLNANESLSVELERYKERVKLLEERQNVDLSTQEKLIMDDIIQEKNAQFADFEKEINYLKQTLSEKSKEKELLTKTFIVFKNESKEIEAKNIDKEIPWEKKVNELDNIKSQQIMPMLYDGSVIAKETNVISIANSEDTLMLEEESQSKMLLKQNFGKLFVPQQELFDEQTFRLQTSHPNTDQSASSPVKIEAPQELLKVSMVNTSLKKIKYHLVQFDNVVKKRITPDALTEGKWGFEHTKAVFKEFLIKNDRLLDQIISQDIVNIVVNSSLGINTFVNVNSSVAINDSVNYVEMCNKCLELEDELIEQHYISLELTMQLNKEIFQKNNTSVNQTETSFDQLFELNNLKAELQAKDTTIEKLKANIKCLNKTSTTNNVKKDIDEIETINIELEHRVTKLIVENDHLKQTYKQLYDSIKPLRVKAKEHAESLVNQLNQKSVEITDLNV